MLFSKYTDLEGTHTHTHTHTHTAKLICKAAPRQKRAARHPLINHAESVVNQQAHTETDTHQLHFKTHRSKI